MKKRLLLIAVLFSGALFAQTVADVQNVTLAAQATLTTLQSITGTDGTVCTLSKIPNKTIYAWFTCKLANQTLSTVQVQSTSTVSGSVVLSQGAVLCIVGVNPTSAAVAFGSVGSAPASGIAWACIPGVGGTIVTGTESWP